MITLEDVSVSTKSYRTLVFEQHSRMMEELSDQLLVNKQIKRERIKQDSDVICVCRKPRHTSIQTIVQPCCNFTFHEQCLLQYLTQYYACPYCSDMTRASPTLSNTLQAAPTLDSSSELGPYCKEVTTTNDPTKPPMGADMMAAADTCHNNARNNVREESVKKRRLLQDSQGEKMKKRHQESLQQLGKDVRRGSMVTLHIDRRVASHARGVTAVVVDCCPNTGGIIACSSKGIIVNGVGKKEWWIAADMYKLRTNPGELYTAIAPDLAAIQTEIIEGRFDSSTHPKCNLREAHAHVVGASSPCKRNNCGCKKGKCTKRCGCVRNKISCSSTCSCSGNCTINQLNHNRNVVNNEI